MSPLSIHHRSRAGHAEQRALAPRRRTGLGFTLTELIVAVGAVALLTVGIGQLFSSVQRLVGGGAAIAEADQFARAFSSQLQDDFAALSRMKSAETFMAIRCRRLGDSNGNNALDAGETAIYLNQNDRDADQRDNIQPYAAGSRAITVRLDDMAFLAFSGGDKAYASAQVGDPAGGTAPESQVARIYYGHALRPAQDRTFDPTNPAAGARGNTPPRIFIPDGDFGQLPGANNPFDTGNVVNSGLVTGRNTFAGSWPLARQALVMYGGLATGYAPDSSGALTGAPFGTRYTYAPYIRPLEALGAERSYWPLASIAGGGLFPTPRPANPLVPQPRLLTHGRTDVCAQASEDAIRWLEGLDPVPLAGEPAERDASAFTSGRLEADSSAQWTSGPFVQGDAPLWRRVKVVGNDNATEQQNRRSLWGALAGCLARLQVESSPPLVDRGDSLRADGTGARQLQPNEDFPQAAFMDTHALIGSRISSFEIAWTDGSRWLGSTPADVDGDGVANDPDDATYGDMLWFDIDFTRYTRGGASDLSDLAGGLVEGPSPVDIDLNPEVHPGQRADLVHGLETAGPGRYDPLLSGGDRSATGENEYMAIFPFRAPNGSGGYVTAGSYRKPTKIRVRMTVHDAQFRIPGGRTYEFVLPVNLRD